MWYNMRVSWQREEKKIEAKNEEMIHGAMVYGS
jgi:hypothetical protein